MDLDLLDASSAKRSLRTDLRTRRSGLGPMAADQAAAKVAETLAALPEMKRARRVFLCLSFGGELDTWSLASRLLEEGKQLFVPRAAGGERRLSVHLYPCRLETTSFGLRQPVAKARRVKPPAIDSTLDLALVLGLGFDLSGYRLGYGAGYFDRFLAGRPFPTIGLAFDCQLVERLPVEAHDVPMTRVVTEARSIVPSRP